MPRAAPPVHATPLRRLSTRLAAAFLAVGLVPVGVAVPKSFAGDADPTPADAQRAGAEVVLNSDHDDVASAVLDHTQGQGVRGMVDVDLGAHLVFAPRIVAVIAVASERSAVLNDFFPFLCFSFLHSQRIL